MKNAVSIPEPLLNEVEDLAKRLGMSRSRLFREALAAYVTSHNQQHMREVLNEIYSDESSTVDPALTQIQLNYLSDESW